MRAALALAGAAALIWTGAAAAAAERQQAGPALAAAMEKDDDRAAYAAIVPQLTTCLAAHPADDTCLDIAALAGILASSADKTNARALLTGALALADRTVRPEGEDHARIASSLAGQMVTEADFPAALPHARRAAELGARVFGPRDHWTVGATIQLAQVLSMLGRHGEAVPPLRTLAADLAKDAKAGAADVVDAHEALGDALLSTGDARGAEAAYRTALAYESAAGSKRRNAQLLYGLATALDRLGRKDEARQLATEAARGAPPGSILAKHAGELAGLVVKDMAPEEKSQRDMIAMVGSLQGENSPGVTMLNAKLAIWLVKHGRRAEADALLATVNAALLDPKLPPKARLNVFLNFAGYEVERGNWTRARGYFASAHRAAREAYSETDPMLIDTEYMYGLGATAVGDRPLARTMLRSAAARVLRRLNAAPEYDTTAQSELRGYAGLFRRIVRLDWMLAQR